MSEFEQQLRKAIEHGCPICRKRHGGGWGWLEVTKRLTVVSVPLLGSGSRIEWERFGEEILVESEYVQVECDTRHHNGKGIFWTAENGWIPELHEVVSARGGE